MPAVPVATPRVVQIRLSRLDHWSVYLQVREWICQTAQGCEFDVPTAIYDAHDFEVVLSPWRPGNPC